MAASSSGTKRRANDVSADVREGGAADEAPRVPLALVDGNALCGAVATLEGGFPGAAFTKITENRMVLTFHVQMPIGGIGGIVVKVTGKPTNVNEANIAQHLILERAKQDSCSETLVKILMYKWHASNVLVVYMEPCGPDLFELTDRKKRLLPSVVTNVLRDVSQALKVLHELGAAHMDVKLDNIFYQSGAFKLGDFDLTTFEETLSIPQVGTTFYIAPENIMAGKEKPYKTRPTDLWSLGIVAYIITSTPWKNPDLKTTVAEYRALQKDAGSMAPVPTWVYNDENKTVDECFFMLNCLLLQPEKRWTAQAALKFLSDPPSASDGRRA